MKKWIGLVVAALLPVCLSCTTDTDGDGEIHGPTTVLALLERFEEAWNDGYVDEYRLLLDEDNFTFYFDPQDVGYDDIPYSWDYEAEIAAFTNLFDAVGAMNVILQLDFSDVSEPKEEADTCALNDIAYLLYVALPDLDVVLKADGWLNLQLEKLGGEWVVTGWSDFSLVRLPGIVETTWGWVKVNFSGDDDE